MLGFLVFWLQTQLLGALAVLRSAVAPFAAPFRMMTHYEHIVCR